jgi:hypothetical protein
MSRSFTSTWRFVTEVPWCAKPIHDDGAYVISEDTLRLLFAAIVARQQNSSLFGPSLHTKWR